MNKNSKYLSGGSLILAVLFFISILISGTRKVDASLLQNDEIIKLNEIEGPGWQVNLRTDLMDQHVQVVLDKSTEVLTEASAELQDGSKIPLLVTSDRKAFEESLLGYFNWKEEEAAFESAVIKFNKETEEYLKKVEEYNLLVSEYNRKAEEYSKLLEKYNEEYSEYKLSIDPQSSNTLSATEPVPPESPGEPPEAPVAPVFPEDIKDQSNSDRRNNWAILLKAEDSESYYIVIPEKTQISSLEFLVKREEIPDGGFNTTAYTTFNNGTHEVTYESSVEILSDKNSNNINNPSLITTSQEETTSDAIKTDINSVTDQDSLETTKTYVSPESQVQPETSSDTLTTVTSEITSSLSNSSNTLETSKIITLPEPIIENPITVNKGTKITPESIIKNTADFPEGTVFSWKTEPDTGTSGDKEAVLLITNGDVVTEYKVKISVNSQIMKRMMAPSALNAATMSLDIFARDQFGNPVPGLKVELYHYIYSLSLGRHDLAAQSDGVIYVKTTDTTGHTTYGGIVRDGVYPFYYVRIVGQPPGYAPLPANGLSGITGGDLFSFREGIYYGAYSLDANGILSSDTGWRRPNGNSRAVYSPTYSALIELTAYTTNLSFKKKDASTSLGIPGAEFQLSKTDEITYTKTILSDSNGNLNLKDLTYGTYSLGETVPADGYTLNTTKLYFDVVMNSAGNGVVAQNFRTVKDGVSTAVNGGYSFTNTPTTLKFKKTDEKGNPLSGSQFTLKNSAGTAETVKTTDGFNFEYKYLKAGNYTLTETVSPNRYALPLETFKISVSRSGIITFSNSDYITPVIQPDGSTLFSIKNLPHTMELFFIKLGAKDAPLKGAEFELRRKDGTGEVLKGNSLVSGEVHIPGLTEGTYILKETVTPSGYYKNVNTTEFDVVLRADNSGLDIKNIKTYDTGDPSKVLTPDLLQSGTGRYEFRNKRETYSFYKVDENGKGLSGAQFMVINDAKPDDVLIKISDSTGRVTLNRTAEKSGSTFTVTEIKAPLGYVLSKAVWKITVNGSGEVTMNKISDSSNPQEVTAMTGTSVVDGSSDQLKVINRLQKYYFKFKKTGLNGTPLEGAEFKLTEVTQTPDNKYQEVPGGFTRTVVSGADGMINYPDLPVGMFKLQETKSPQGYVPLTGIYDVFKVYNRESDNTLVADFIPGEQRLLVGDDNKGYSVPNTIISDFTLTKYGYNDSGTIIAPFKNPVSPLPGAEFELKGITDPSFLEKVTSDAQGKVGFTDIKPGEYELRETFSPPTHLKSEAIYTLTVTNLGTSGIEYKITRKSGPPGDDFLVSETEPGKEGLYRKDIAINKKNPAVIKFIKTGTEKPGETADKPLAGAEFTIYEFDTKSGQRTGQPLGTGVSGPDGVITFKNMTPGRTYEILETGSPLGYISTEGLKGRVEVSSTGEVIWDKTNSLPSEFWDFTNTDGIPRIKNSFNPIFVNFLVRDDPNNKNGDYGNPIGGAKFVLVSYSGTPETGLTEAKRFEFSSNEAGLVDYTLENYEPPRTADGKSYFTLFEVESPEGFNNPLLKVTGKAPDTNNPSGGVQLILQKDNDFSINPDSAIKYEHYLLLDPNKGFIVINDPIFTNLSFTKINGRGNGTLGLSEFRVYSETLNTDGTPIYDSVNAQTGREILNFDGLKIGKYYIEELKAPAGFALLPNPIQIEIKEKKNQDGTQTGVLETIIDPKDINFIEYIDTSGDGIANDLAVKNYTAPELPSTGGPGTIIFLFAGAFLMLTAAAIYTILKKRTRNTRY